MNGKSRTGQSRGAKRRRTENDTHESLPASGYLTKYTLHPCIRAFSDIFATTYTHTWIEPEPSEWGEVLILLGQVLPPHSLSSRIKDKIASGTELMRTQLCSPVGNIPILDALMSHRRFWRDETIAKDFVMALEAVIPLSFSLCIFIYQNMQIITRQKTWEDILDKMRLRKLEATNRERSLLFARSHRRCNTGRGRPRCHGRSVGQRYPGKFIVDIKLITAPDGYLRTLAHAWRQLITFAHQAPVLRDAVLHKMRLPKERDDNSFLSPSSRRELREVLATIDDVSI